MSFREQVVVQYVLQAVVVCVALFAVGLLVLSLWRVFVTDPRHRRKMDAGYLMLFKMRHGIYDLPTHPRRSPAQIARDEAILRMYVQ